MAYREAPELEETPFDGLLDEDEELLFVANARTGFRLRKSDAVVVPVTLLWAGFAIFWTISATRGGGAFGLFGVPFMLIGAYIVAGRFVHDAYRRKRTTYGLTDQRILIRTGGTLRSLPLDNLSDVALDESADGAGTISIGKPGPFGGAGDTFWQGQGQGGHRLDLPSDARAFYKAIMSAKRGSRAEPHRSDARVRVEAASDEAEVQAAARPASRQQSERE